MEIASTKPFVRTNIGASQKSLGIRSLERLLFRSLRSELIVEQRERMRYFRL
jgi:hypothetical protein